MYVCMSSGKLWSIGLCVGESGRQGDQGHQSRAGQLCQPDLFPDIRVHHRPTRSQVTHIHINMHIHTYIHAYITYMVFWFQFAESEDNGPQLDQLGHPSGRNRS